MNPQSPIRWKLKWSFRGLAHLIKEFDMATGLPKGLHLVLAKRYESFIKRRFRDHARGGGSPPWQKLSAATIRRRGTPKGATRDRGSMRYRSKKTGRFVKKGRIEILRDTGTMFKALSIGGPGNTLKKIKGGVRFSVMGAGRHPRYKGKIGDLILIHQLGKGRVPARPVLVEPDEKTVEQMRQATKRTLARVMSEANSKQKAVRRGR